MADKRNVFVYNYEPVGRDYPFENPVQLPCEGPGEPLNAHSLSHIFHLAMLKQMELEPGYTTREQMPFSVQLMESQTHAAKYRPMDS